MTGLARRNRVTLPLVGSLLLPMTASSTMPSTLCARPAGKKVGVARHTFKSGTDDLRESPFIDLIGMMGEAGIEVKGL